MDFENSLETSELGLDEDEELEEADQDYITIESDDGSENEYHQAKRIRISSDASPQKEVLNALRDRIEPLNKKDSVSTFHILFWLNELHKIQPNIQGFADPETFSLPTYKAKYDQSFLNIIKIQNHWICVSNRFSRNMSEICVYDSDNSISKNNINELKEKIAKMTTVSPCYIKLMKVQQQNNKWDSGLFSVANATSICFNSDPSTIKFKKDELRESFNKSIEQKKIDVDTFKFSKTLLKSECIASYCF
jgi:hypothetical protein